MRAALPIPLMLLIATPVWAEPSVADRIARLGDDRYSERVAAERALLASGPGAIPALDRAAAEDPDAEVRARASRIAISLRKTAEASARIAVSPISLNYVGVPLSTAIADLRAKTGIPLTLDLTHVADPMRTVSVQSGPLPPWEAVEAFCAAAGLRESFAEREAKANPQPEMYRMRRRVVNWGPGGENGNTPMPAAIPVLLADGKHAVLPGNRSTAVRVLALPATTPGTHVIRGSGEVVIVLDVAPLPGVGWRGATSVRIARAIDDGGRIVPGAHQSSEERETSLDGDVFPIGMVAFDGVDFGGQSGPQNSRRVPLRLKTDDRPVKALAVLEGTVVGEIVLPNQILASFVDLPNAGARATTIDRDRTVGIDGYETRADGRAMVRVRVDAPNEWNAFAVGRRPALGTLTDSGIGNFQFFDATGKLLPQPQIVESGMSDDGVRQISTMAMLFSKASKPVRMTLVGTKAASLEVPFRLENVRLP